MISFATKNVIRCTCCKSKGIVFFTVLASFLESIKTVPLRLVVCSFQTSVDTNVKQKISTERGPAKWQIYLKTVTYVSIFILFLCFFSSQYMPY